MAFVFKTQSPLQNPLILELVSSHLPTVDLRSCVQVSSLWSTEMGRVLKSRRALDINFRNPKSITTIKENLLKNSHKSGFAFQRMNFIGHLPREDGFFNEILSKWGLLLSEINISGYHSTWTAPTFYKLLSDFSPNLETLNVHLQSESDRIINRENHPNAGHQNVRLFHDPLIRELRNINREFQYSRLKVLRWHVFVHSDHCFQKEMMDMCYIFPSLTALTISTLDFYIENSPNVISEQESQPKIYWQSLQTIIYQTYELSSTTFEKLTALSLNVKSLSLMFNYLTPHQPECEISDAISGFLKSISSTLKNLAIFRRPIYGTFQDCSEKIPLNISLPRLPLLDTFKLFPGGSLPVQLPTLSKTGTMENLAHFSGSFADVCSSYLSFSNLKSLNVILPQGILLDTSISSRVFPSVTHLVLHPYGVSDENFRKLILMFPNLQSLKIKIGILNNGARPFSPQIDPNTNFDPLTDSGITGISTEDLHLLFSSTQRISPEVLSALRKYPWIGSLKHLSKVEINFQHTLLTGKTHLFGTRCLALK